MWRDNIKSWWCVCRLSLFLLLSLCLSIPNLIVIFLTFVLLAYAPFGRSIARIMYGCVSYTFRERLRKDETPEEFFLRVCPKVMQISMSDRNIAKERGRILHGIISSVTEEGEHKENWEWIASHSGVAKSSGAMERAMKRSSDQLKSELIDLRSSYFVVTRFHIWLFMNFH